MSTAGERTFGGGAFSETQGWSACRSRIGIHAEERRGDSQCPITGHNPTGFPDEASTLLHGAKETLTAWDVFSPVMQTFSTSSR